MATKSDFFTVEDDIEAYLNSSEFQNFMASVAFVGFDPVKTRDAILQVDDFDISDVIMMIEVHISKGNNLYSILKKMRSNDRLKFEKLIKKYKLKSKVAAPHEITLSRVVSSFPINTALILHEYNESKTPRPVGITKMATYSDIPFPKVLMNSAVASCIPTTSFEMVEADHIKAIIACINAYSTLHSKEISNKDADLDIKILYNKTMTYTELAHKSPILTDSERREICRTLPFKEIFVNTENGLTVATFILDLAKELLSKLQ